jgi:diguanylate cyclase (GGDEF)-like protein
LVLVGAVDVLTGPEISLSFFYLLPVALVAWTMGLGLAIAFAVVGGAVLFMSDRLAEASYTSDWIPYLNAVFRTGIFVAMACVVSSLHATLVRERSLAREDAVTGTATRRRFFELAELERERAARYGHPITLAYVDLDGFKSVNDRLGHAEGDVLLRLAAQAIQDNVRSSDIVGRLGGDEFGILFPQIEPDQADAAVRKIHTCIQSVHASVGASVGFVTFQSPPPSVEDMVAWGDRLMYRAKADGPGGISRQYVSGPPPPVGPPPG